MANEEKLPTEMLPLNELTIWGQKGTLKASIKNGFPRFVFFLTEGGFITIPLGLSMYVVIPKLIDRVVESKEDVKYTLECSNNDWETKEMIVVGYLVIARRGNKIMMAVKRNATSESYHVELSTTKWVRVHKNDDVDNIVGETMNATATGYADMIRLGITANYHVMTAKNNVPNSERSNKSSKPDYTPRTVDTKATVSEDDMPF